jgi:hypothetical protein
MYHKQGDRLEAQSFQAVTPILTQSGCVGKYGIVEKGNTRMELFIVPGCIINQLTNLAANAVRLSLNA